MVRLAPWLSRFWGGRQKRKFLPNGRQNWASGKNVLAVGDGSNDLAMLGIAGMGVAFRAKPAVAETARYRVTHGDLTALLYLQGYRQEDFA